MSLNKSTAYLVWAHVGTKKATEIPLVIKAKVKTKMLSDYPVTTQ